MPITVDMVLEGLTKRENKTIQLEIEVSAALQQLAQFAFLLLIDNVLILFSHSQTILHHSAKVPFFAVYTGGRKDILLLSEERLYSSFSLKVYHNTKEEEIILGRAGEEWKYAGNKLRVILDDTACLEFTINFS